MAYELPFISSLAKFCYAMATFSATMEKQTKEMNEMKNNYLSRFEGLTEKINTTEKTILEKMNENHIKVIDRINAKK